uniref:CSD domain-containing protein n=1 Tax=viral metagenome TaxID=1070528 RepID=A0A6C0KWJ7_9ZZZZ
METVSETPSLVTSSDRLMGRVKWFNNQAGYGFITVTDGPRAGSDIFVHHSGVQVSSEQYKYLVQGEYVEFKLNSTPGGVHEFQASDVSGIKNGKLMCETRREFKQARNNYKGSSSEDGEQEQQQEEDSKQRVRAPRSTRPPAREESRGSSRAPKRVEQDGQKKEWTLVDKKKSAPRKPRAPKEVV